MKHYQILLKKVKKGFNDLPFSQKSKNRAIEAMKIWFEGNMFNIYVPYILYFIKEERWGLLFDSFHKTINFGTGGRRGLVGIGPNRINICTVKLLAQGHSQYLKNCFGKSTSSRGIVLGYDVRECYLEGIKKELTIDKNGILSSYSLAFAVAGVYAANNIKVYIFQSARSTPMLSFAIRYLNAIGGCMFSASHNLPQYNGEKIYNEHGSQILPHEGDNISYEIKKKYVLKEINFKTAIGSNLVMVIDREIDESYYDIVTSISINNKRDIKILYSSLHGTGLNSVYPILLKSKFIVDLHELTSTLDGSFSNILFNIPNPELEESFDNLIEYADLCTSDIIMNTDPDADRLGVMVYDTDTWKFLNGNQIGIILTEYILANLKVEKFYKQELLIIKTVVTSSLISVISERNGINCIEDLLIGFKYICNILNELEKNNVEDHFLLGVEESHGFLIGSYCRDKDASGAAILIAELAAKLKQDGKTLIDYLHFIYSKYGYCHNYLTEIRLCDPEGLKQIKYLMKYFRKENIIKINNYKTKIKLDFWKENIKSNLSNSEKNAYNIIIFKIKDQRTNQDIKLVIRPSGTEPKFKIYIEILSSPFDIVDVDQVMAEKKKIRQNFEKVFLNYCYKIMNISLPDRSFFLFKQMPLNDKLKYFKIESKIELLIQVKNSSDRYRQLLKLLSFLGVDPVKKIDLAFSKKHGYGVLKYLGLEEYLFKSLK